MIQLNLIEELPFPSILVQTSYYLNYLNKAIDAHQIHSPFVFNLYVDLIQKRNNESIFQELISWFRLNSKNVFGPTFINRSCLRFIEKLAKRQEINQVQLIGFSTNEQNEPFILKVSILAQHFYSNKTPFLKENQGLSSALLTEQLWGDSCQMAVINLSTVKGPIDKYLQSLIAHTNTIEVIILTNIYSSQRNKNIWFRITMCQALPLSLDLFKMGILFTKIKLEKQHFTLKW